MNPARDPATFRAAVRTGEWTGVTTGVCPGFLQANLAVLPAAYAEEFAEFCRANPRPLPLLEMTAPGVPDQLKVASGADLRTYLPRYRVWRSGQVVAEVTDVGDLWRDDLVGFLLGCSFTAEASLADAGVRLRHMDLARNVAMYETGLDCVPAGRFHGPMVVSMRPIRTDQLALAERATGAFPLAHGGPVHRGDPLAIGIEDLDRPHWGDPIDIRPDEVPVFWACGVTPQAAIARTKPDFAITHAPGHMFVTDVVADDVRDRQPPLVA